MKIFISTWLFVILLAILTIFLYQYDIAFNQIYMGVTLLSIYYIINLSYLFCSKTYISNKIICYFLIGLYFALSFVNRLLGLPILFLVIIIFIKLKKERIIKIISVIILLLFIIISSSISYISSTITYQVQDLVKNPKGNLSITTLYVDTGATGASYLYRVDYNLINTVFIHKTLLKSKEHLLVQWLNNSTCKIGTKEYYINFP
jgi:hypothetical protein